MCAWGHDALATHRSFFLFSFFLLHLKMQLSDHCFSLCWVLYFEVWYISTTNSTSALICATKLPHTNSHKRYSAFGFHWVGPHNITIVCSKSCTRRLVFRLSSHHPIIIFWGPHRWVILFNDNPCHFEYFYHVNKYTQVICSLWLLYKWITKSYDFMWSNLDPRSFAWI